MRYCVEQATAKDVALLAMAMGVDPSTQPAQGGEEQFEHLVGAFMSSTEVWAAHDAQGQPRALWGAGPMSPDGQVGRFWLLTSAEIDTTPADLLALSVMVLPEMLSRYARLESMVDAQNTRAVELLRVLGFTVEPARLHRQTGQLCHHAWVDADESPMTPKTTAVLLN